MTPQNLPTVVIVGRPNVGKSSLYNRILGRKEAIVLREAGITRDAICNTSVWNERKFLLFDTGGLNLLSRQKKDESQNQFDSLIRERLEQSCEIADVILFVVDAQEGLQPMDHEVTKLLRRMGKEVILVMNKTDNADLHESGLEMNRLGFGEPIPISITHNYNVTELLDQMVEKLPRKAGEDEEEVEPELKIAIVGRPNVGKSSTVNRLLGHNRVIVSDVAGTTRDAIDIPFEIQRGDMKIPALLIDTAGLRLKRKVDTVVERFSMMRTENAIKRADLVIFITDATDAGTSQDRRLCGMIEESGKACIVLVNKWDLAPNRVSKKVFEEWMLKMMPGMAYAPMLYASAETGENHTIVLNTVFEIMDTMQTRIPTVIINQFFDDLTQRHTPPMINGKSLRIYYATMVNQAPPTFKLFVNDPDLCTDTYLAFVRNKIQEVFKFRGLPVKLQLIRRKRREFIRG